MKVLLLAQFYPPVVGGEERHVQGLAEELASRGHEVHVGTQAPAGQPARIDRDGAVVVHHLRSTLGRVPSLYEEADRPHAAPLPDPELSSGLRHLVAQVSPHIVHAHNWIVNSYLPIRKMSQAPLVLSLHDYSNRCSTKRLMNGDELCSGPAPLKCLFCASERYGWARGPMTVGATAIMASVKRRGVDYFLPVSRAVVDGNALASTSVPYEVVPNFVRDELLSAPAAPAPPEMQGRDYLLFVGDLSRDKGVPTLLAAYERLPEGRPKLLLLGRRTDSAPDQLPVGVVIGGPREHAKVVTAFKSAIAAALPSEWADPCPTTVLEAQALGTPVVTTRLGGMVDMVEDGSTGLLVEPGDSVGLSLALLRVIQDQSLRTVLAEGGRRSVQRFLLSRVVDQLERVYAKVLGTSHLA